MRDQRGFAYLLLLIGIAVLGVGLAAIGTVASVQARHERQLQLSWVGQQYVNAIGSYYQSSPGSVSVYPRTLEDLLEDKRYLSVRRHIRELYLDPATGEADWIAVAAPDGGLMGVASLESHGIPGQKFLYQPPTIKQSQ